MGKINKLITSWSKGQIKLASYLNSLGYRSDLLNKYTNSEWLDSLGYGAFKLHNDKIEWYSGINALQNQSNKLLHPGGKTALELKGYSHYLKQKKTAINIYSPPKENFPAWFNNQKWKEDISLHRTNLFDYKKIDCFVEFEIKGIKIKISSPELAAFEMLYLIPNKQTFEEVYLVMENLTTLRPKTVQYLLEKCNSVKVKRLFLFIAEKINHQWFSELNLKKVKLGAGNREVVKNGLLDKKYLITIPRNYAI